MDEPQGGMTVRTGPRVTGRLIFGLVVIWVGLLFLLDEFGLLDASAILRWWPVAMLGFGLMRLAGIGVRQHFATGIVLTMLGGWFLLRAAGFSPFGITEFWPIILIVLGAIMVTGGLRASRPAAKGDAASASTLSAFAFWSGVDRKVVSNDFRGGDLAAFMGGHDIDLRAAKMADGTATIDLFVVMGGVDMRVPEDWAVNYDGVLIMGGVEDRTKPPVGEVRGRLILKGFVMMGGVEVKN